MAGRTTKKAWKIPATVLAAIIGLVGTCVTIICSSPILVKLIDIAVSTSEPPTQLVESTDTPPPTRTLSPTETSFPTQIPSPTESLGPTIEIIGPDTVPFGEETYFTFISQNATHAEWSIGGFENNEIFVVDPLAPSHQIFVRVTNSDRIGDIFVIAVTVYSENGDTAKAVKQFTVVQR